MALDKRARRCQKGHGAQEKGHGAAPCYFALDLTLHVTNKCGQTDGHTDKVISTWLPWLQPRDRYEDLPSIHSDLLFDGVVHVSQQLVYDMQDAIRHRDVTSPYFSCHSQTVHIHCNIILGYFKLRTSNLRVHVHH